MIIGLTVLLVCQLVGEAAARSFGLPVPGPVLGLVLLVAVLHVTHRPGRTPAEQFEAAGVVRVADGLLANLSLLFVPAGVGVIDQLGVLQAQAFPIGCSLVISTVLALVVTVLVFVGMKRLLRTAPGEVTP